MQETLTLILGVVSVLLGLAAFYFWKYPRTPELAMRYRITQDRPLIGHGPLTRTNLEVRAGEAILGDPWVWSVVIENAGKGPIRPSDFGSDVIFVLSIAKEKIFQIQAVGETTMGDFGETPDGNFFLGFAPQVLNVGDTAEVAILSEGKPELLEVNARLAGISELVRRPPLDELYELYKERTVRSARRFRILTIAVAAITMALVVLEFLFGPLFTG